MARKNASRRQFLKTSAATAATVAATPYFFTGEKSFAQESKSANDRPIVGFIGTGDRWNALKDQALRFGDAVAGCDADSEHAASGKAKVEDIQAKAGRERKVDTYEDYRKLLDRKDIEVVVIATPDHWHSKIAIDAMKAGKDVYCEKPLTLTIDEGKKIVKVLRETKRVFQVGTQQRTEMNANFLKAVALAHSGRLGQIKRVQCAIGGAPSSPEIPVAPVPSNLNWDLWLGQAPMTEYRLKALAEGQRGYPHSRTHYEFRWWYEYSGGKMTDWGAHHVDIAAWAIKMDQGGPLSVEGTAKHPVPFENGNPTRDDMYNTATEFMVTAKCPGDIDLVIRHDTENGVTIEGTEGTIFVSRGALKGPAVDALKDNPLPEGTIEKLCKGKKPGNHMGNFFECVKDRSEPMSDVYSHHRAMTICHLANIAIRLNKKIMWDAEKELIVGDEDAAKWMSRPQRKGYEVEA